ncbi:hypothetical protein B7463_g8948, partial [Scytalidium lignicola]
MLQINGPGAMNLFVRNGRGGTELHVMDSRAVEIMDCHFMPPFFFRLGQAQGNVALGVHVCIGYKVDGIKVIYYAGSRGFFPRSTGGLGVSFPPTNPISFEAACFSTKNTAEDMVHGWHAAPYRVLFRKTFDMVTLYLGRRRAGKWVDQFIHLLQLTHWVLPYPGPHDFIQLTKINQDKGLRGRMMWFSCIYQPGDPPREWPEDQPYTLAQIIQRVESRQPGGATHNGQWDIPRLILACSAQGLTASACCEGWILGRQARSRRAPQRPLWEEGHVPPRLRLLGLIEKKSLDELDSLILQFQRDLEHNSSKTMDSSVTLDDMYASTETDTVGSNSSSASLFESE